VGAVVASGLNFKRLHRGGAKRRPPLRAAIRHRVVHQVAGRRRNM
jgi:hypothetical protein